MRAVHMLPTWSQYLVCKKAEVAGETRRKLVGKLVVKGEKVGQIAYGWQAIQKTVHRILDDWRFLFTSVVVQAAVRFHQKNYKEALSHYKVREVIPFGSNHFAKHL